MYIRIKINLEFWKKRYNRYGFILVDLCVGWLAHDARNADVWTRRRARTDWTKPLELTERTNERANSRRGMKPPGARARFCSMFIGWYSDECLPSGSYVDNSKVDICDARWRAWCMRAVTSERPCLSRGGDTRIFRCQTKISDNSTHICRQATIIDGRALSVVTTAVCIR